MQQQWQQAKTMIEAANTILLTTHVRPDGDAVGSLMALKRAIQQLSTQRHGQGGSQGTEASCPRVDVLWLSPVPSAYEFLVDEPTLLFGREITEADVNAGRLDEYDLVIVADTAATRQLPGIADVLKGRSQGVLVFDHHLSSDGIGHCSVVDTSASAAGQLVYGFLKWAGWAMDESSAEALFVAVGTDTGWFRFENCSAGAFGMAGELVALGARPDRLYRRLFQQFPPARLRLLARVLDSLELFCDEQVAVLQVTQAMLRETNAEQSLLENMVNETQQIGSVVVSLLFVEQGKAKTRVSFRSIHSIDVNELARCFDGGGHARAAGATLHESLAEAKRQVLERVLKVTEQSL